jgi:ectoine hydroxylase-related dioxygenase (phytanoyl-CoA dioxygenase family)
MTDFLVSSDAIADFQRDGYIIVPGLLDPEETAGLRGYVRGDDALSAESYVRRDSEGAETRLALRNDLDDSCCYSSVARSRRVAETMSKLLGDEVYHYHHKMILKEPHVGGAWEWHQDYGYWYNFGCLYPDMGSCMIAVDQATPENGCLQVLRGSHHLGRINHVRTGEQVGADPERVQAVLDHLALVYCEMAAGDAIFFHANLLHRSDRNCSDHPRWSLICCYNTRHNDPVIRNGRHPNYSPLEIWPDERVRVSLTGAAN